MRKETIITKPVTTLEDLQAALVEIFSLARFYANRRIQRDEIAIPIDYVSLQSETLTDGSKVYNILLTQRAPEFVDVVPQASPHTYTVRDRNRCCEICGKQRKAHL